MNVDAADAAQEDTKALGGAAPVLYLAGVAGFELLPLFAPRPIAPISGFLFGVLRLRLWLALLAGLFFGPFQVLCQQSSFVGCFVPMLRLCPRLWLALLAGPFLWPRWVGASLVIRSSCLQPHLRQQ